MVIAHGLADERLGESAPLPPRVEASYWQRLQILRQPHVGLEHVRRTTGPIAEISLGPLAPPLVVVSSAQGVHDVLAGFDGSFDKEMSVHVQSRLFGANLFNLPHEPWKPRRRAVQPVFTRHQVGAYAGHMSEVATSLTREWLRAGRIDLDREARRLTLHVLTRAMLGVDLDPRIEAVGRDVRRLISYPVRRAINPLRPPTWFPTPARTRFRRALARLRAEVDEALRLGRADVGHAAPLVGQLLAATDPDTGSALPADALRDELLAFLVAGHDTTATVLAYALWRLGRAPDLQDRLAAEAAALGDRPLTAEDVKELPFTVQVLHEALRMCPPAAVVGRRAMRDVVVDGYRVAAGSDIAVSIYALHRDPAYWDDPEQFDPDRFSVSTRNDRDRWSYLPFGAGPRSCIGDHFAVLEATIALATIVRAARISGVDPEFPLAVPFTMVAAGPVRASFAPRGAVDDRLSTPAAAPDGDSR